MKRLNFSQYVRNTGIIIGFVFVLFVGFGVQESLAFIATENANTDNSYSLCEWNGVSNGIASIISQQFSTITTDEVIEKVKFKYNADSTLSGTISIGILESFDSESALRFVNVPVSNLILDNEWHYYTATITPLTLFASSTYWISMYKNDSSDSTRCISFWPSDDYSSRKLSTYGYGWNPSAPINGFYFNTELYDQPSIGLLHPATGQYYGNPVKFSGGITDSVEWNIYTGNEVDTTDNLQLSGFSASGVNDDFAIDHAFYLPVGKHYYNVVAYGQGGLVSTSSHYFFVDDAVSSFGTSTVPANPRSDSDLTDYASSTVVGFIGGLGDISACDFDWFSVFDISDWANCSINLYHYTTAYIGEYIFNLFDRVASKWPWGYGYRVLRIITDSTGTASVPDLEFEFPSGMGLPASAVGRSFEFNPVESYASAKSTIIGSNEGTWDTVLYWWNFFCYLTFAFYFVHKLKTLSI